MYRTSILLYSLIFGTIVYAFFCAVTAAVLGVGDGEFFWNMLGCMLAGSYTVYPVTVFVTLVIVWFRRQGLGAVINSSGEPMLAGQRHNERGEPLVMGTSPTGRYPGQSDPWRDGTGMSGSNFDNTGFD